MKKNTAVRRWLLIGGMIALCMAFYAFYPPIFSAIYETGRDFGRSVVNAWFQ